MTKTAEELEAQKRRVAEVEGRIMRDKTTFFAGVGPTSSGHLRSCGCCRVGLGHGVLCGIGP
jgi:hypothetical protein